MYEISGGDDDEIIEKLRKGSLKMHLMILTFCSCLNTNQTAKSDSAILPICPELVPDTKIIKFYILRTEIRFSRSSSKA